MAKTYYATRGFKDSGTEKRFAAGKPVDGTEGELANYEKAGLVTTDKPAAEAAAKANEGGTTA